MDEIGLSFDNKGIFVWDQPGKKHPVLVCKEIFNKQRNGAVSLILSVIGLLRSNAKLNHFNWEACLKYV